MKIAHITNTAWFLRHILLNQVTCLRQAGYEVVCISPPGPEIPAIEAAGVRHLTVPLTRNFTPGRDTVSLGRFYQALRRARFTLVHTHNPKPGLLGQLAARMAGVPIVVNTLHGFYFHDHMAPLWRRFYIATETVAARCSDVILSQNREDIGTAVREGICSPEKLRHLGNGIDLRRFDRSRLDPQVLKQKRRDLGLPPTGPVVGFVGRLVAEKGILEFLQAAGRVRRHFGDVRFLVIGPVDAEKPDAFTPAGARAYGVEDVCLFPGMRQDLPELYALMDVFVLPSHREGFPRSLMEAAAMGVPCVATDIRGCREAVEHGRNGLLVPRGRVGPLAEAIMDLLRDQKKAQAMGLRGREMALELFDERLVFDTVKAEYERLLGLKGMPVPAGPPVQVKACY